MNMINYTKKLATIHLNLNDYKIVNGLVNESVVDTLQAIINVTTLPIKYFKATYDDEIISKLVERPLENV